VKTIISFVTGAIICTLILYGAKTVMPTQAESENITQITENTTISFVELLPDIEKIYRDSLIMPFQKAESKIYDKDIAKFYGELLDTTGLRPQEAPTN
jgi:hypothetical protein